MTNEQLYLAIGVPVLLNGLMFLALNWRISDLKQGVNQRFDDLKDLINARFAAVDARFDTAKAELLRVEQVMDARVKHLEEK